MEWNKPLNLRKKHVGGEGNRDFFPAVLSLLFADCQNGWGRSEFLAASTESGNADQLMHGALRRDVCIFVRIWADTLYEVKISGI